MNSCITCGMPFTGDHLNDIGLELPEGSLCKFDVANGRMKSGEEIFDGGVDFFVDEVAEGDIALATRITRKNMNSLPYWQTHPFAKLAGAEATDEEFQHAMAKL